VSDWRLFPVRFDENLWKADFRAGTSAARYQALAWRRRIEILGGISVEALRACDAEDQGGIELPLCVKTRIPRPENDGLTTSPWGAVLRYQHEAGKPRFAFLAFGPRDGRLVDSRTPSVYRLAHERLFHVG
jgi:hypothetical protein